MKQVFDLTKMTAGQHEPLPLFAVTSLGIIESLVAGSLSSLRGHPRVLSWEEHPFREDEAGR